MSEMRPKPIRLRGWRRLAAALWSEPNDPQIYGFFDVDASALVAFVHAARERGEHVTPTHLAGRAIARALAAVPDLNVRLTRSHAIPRPTVDIFFITALQQAHGRDLSGIKVVSVDRKDVFSVARELGERSARLKQGEDKQLARAKRSMDWVPYPFLRFVLRLTAWAVGERGWNVPALGLEASPFGSAMVSSVGMFGLPSAFSPLVWLYRVPLMLLIGEIEDRPRAVGGQVVVRPVLPVTCTVDHRYVDGAHLGKALQAFREYLADPARFEAEPARPGDT